MIEVGTQVRWRHKTFCTGRVSVLRDEEAFVTWDEGEPCWVSEGELEELTEEATVVQGEG